MWIIIGAVINWLGFLSCMVFGVALPILKVWSRQMDLGSGHPSERRSYKTDLRTAIGGGVATAVVYGIGLLIIVFLLERSNALVRLTIIVLYWTWSVWVAIRSEKKSMPKQPNKNLDGILWWYFIRGKSSRRVHRDEVWVLKWWNLGGFVPAVLTRQIDTFDRENRPVNVKVRYYGTDTVSAIDFRNSVDQDWKTLSEYCDQRSQYGYTDEDPPLFTIYGDKDFSEKYSRITCMELRNTPKWVGDEWAYHTPNEYA